MERSAIVNLEAAGSDDSDYEVDFSSDPSKDNADQNRAFSNDQILHSNSEAGPGDLKEEVTKGVASYVWQEGQQRARKAFSIYANIDILRPYYNVEPREVRDRLLTSLIPKIQSLPAKVPSELYGPTMLVLTLIALLLFQMKSYKVTVQEGTLMGSAFVTCFGYWFGIASFLWVVAFVCDTHIRIVQLLHVLGYALFGHCIVISLTVVIHPNHSHLFFYLIWLIFGGLSSLRMASVLMSRTNGKTQKMVVSATVICLHLFFLFYLHFAYHHVVEDLSKAFGAAPSLVHEVIHDQKISPVEAVEMKKEVPEDFKTVAQSTLESVTKMSKRFLRKGFGGGLSNGNQVEQQFDVKGVLQN